MPPLSPISIAIPRPKGRGLIEARASSFRPTRNGRRFLDRKVEASLKQGEIVGYVYRYSEIPRPKGRGLIEAPPLPAAPRLPRARFLDRKVEASLKPVSGPDASVAPTIPRPKGRGLIEAGWGPTSGYRGNGIPRPKGRGLIEAHQAASRSGPPGADSSTERSRPH